MRRNNERWRAIEARFGRESEMWVSTVRQDGRPHLAPVWFVYLEQRLYFCTGTDTQKWVNLLNNQSITISLPDANQVVIVEGEAHAVGHQRRDQVATYFLNKYEWDFRTDDSTEWRLVEITPQKVLAWGDGHDDEGMRVL